MCYKLENAFLKEGVPALYPELGCKKQNRKLERLALLVKTAWPKATEATILKFAEALRLEPVPALRTIGHVLHCHGIGNTRDESDRECWHGIQESVRAVEWLKSQDGPARNKADRKGTFYIPEETLQVRFELFRELALESNPKVAAVVRRYGMSRPLFYKYLHRFRRYAFWGLVDWVQPGRGRVKVAEFRLSRATPCRQYFRPHRCAVRAQKSCSVKCRIKRRRKLAKIRRERDLQEYRIDERQRQRKCRQRRRHEATASENNKNVSETMSRTGLQMQAAVDLTGDRFNQ